MNSQPEKLGDLRLMPAPVDRFRRPPTQTRLRVRIGGGRTGANNGGATNQTPAEVPLPFFWYDPPWSRASLDRCLFVAEQVGRYGVTISALQGDLSTGGAGLESLTWPRLAPHRCDRAGWSLADAQRATAIELRLGMNRDADGRYLYSAAQMARWHQGQDTSRGAKQQSWVPLLYPPEWSDLSQMKVKVSQLRVLSNAAVFVSCDEANLGEILPAARSAGVDAVILRCQDDPVLALRNAGSLLGASQGERRPHIWLEGGKLEAQDAVKCLALGASAVSIDSMCNPWLLVDDEEHLTGAQRAAINLGVNVGQTLQERLRTQINKKLDAWCSQVAGILQSLLVADVAELNAGHLRRVSS